MALCPHVPWDWLNLRIDDLSDPRVLAVHRELNCLSRYYAADQALIIALATGLAASVYLGRWRLSALVLVGGLLARLVVLAVVWGVPRSVDTVVATSLAWLGPALVAVVFGLLARAASNRLRRQFSPVPNG
jgi:hypothetical protein